MIMRLRTSEVSRPHDAGNGNWPERRMIAAVQVSKEFLDSVCAVQINHEPRRQSRQYSHYRVHPR
jgi:hypothetical protein